MTPEKIVSRDEIVKKQAAKVEAELVNAVRTINAKLWEAASLPVNFSGIEFGSTEWVRREVENRLRDAGWKVNAIADRDGPANYQVQ